MSGTILKRSGTTSYTGMLAVIGDPDWKDETKLFRFVERGGCSTMFTLTKRALQSFADFQLWRIYDIEVPGYCVRRSDPQKTGVHNYLEVKAVSPLNCVVSGTSWPLVVTYDFASWDDLDQKKNGSFVDLIGWVLSPPSCEQNRMRARLTVELGFQEKRLTVHMLGKHASSVIREGDILVFGGLRIGEWQRERTLETIHLTIVEINPAERAGLEVMDHIGEEEPKKKAFRVSLPDVANVKQVQSWSQAMLQNAPTKEIREFVILGKLSTLNESFFDADPPLVGEAPNEKMCWRISLADETGSCFVKVWDKPCRDLFGHTASSLRCKWEEGHEDAEKRTDILQDLNRGLVEVVRCVCKLSIWSFGSKTEKHEPQIDVNLLDMVDC